ncbi:pyridoxal-phosphate dependent enzyme [Natronoarchaeum mannanilyticum]|uniref:Threonine synthase n=1 Tax=Natronoarchaeum mannanilyticum TaxID=926360 RepID=A0AAV3T9K8_9EURY
MVADLRCRDCGRTYAASADEPWRCDCGHPLDYAEPALPDRGSAPAPKALDRDLGLWAFQSFLPEAPLVTLGEGFTPLVDADDWDAAFKLEYLFPTGSFKDRGATTTLSRAAALGVDKVVEDSSGNAGAAIATYAARAGIDADVYVPDDVKQSKLVAIQRAGARPVRIEGDREAVTEACVAAASEGDAYYASHAWNPAFYAGTATLAYEIAAQRDWSAPDAVVLPLGHGTLFLGAYRGFRALREAGYVDRVPKLLAGQAAGYAPIAAELHADDDDDEPGNRLTTALESSEDVPTNEIADGIQIAEPAREAQLFDAIADSGGDAIAIDGDAVEGELDRLHRAGFYVEPTSAVATAALREYRRRGVVAPDDDVVVPLTGSGMKTL